MLSSICYSGLLEMDRGSVKMQKCHKNKSINQSIRHAESIFLEINPVRVGFGPGKYRISNWKLSNWIKFYSIKTHNLVKPKRTVYRKSYSPLASQAALRGSSGVLAPRAFQALRRSGPVFPPLTESNLKSRRQPARQNLPQHRIRRAIAGPTTGRLA